MQVQSFNMAARAIYGKLHHVGFAVPYLVHNGGARILRPGLFACEWMPKPGVQLQVRLPGAGLEIEIALSISQGDSRTTGRALTNHTRYPQEAYRESYAGGDTAA
jgi:hypothetical protein